MKHKVVAGVRTKDEEWIIEKTLAALQNFCHKVVVYDDNSIDKTKEMCNSFDVVDWHEGPPRNPLIWKAGEQFSDLFKHVRSHEPEYILLLDADEIPTPNIVDFFEKIDENINLWKVRMVNLWQSEEYYRADSFFSKVVGGNIGGDPFGTSPWTKHLLMKNDPAIDYVYDLQKVGLGGVTPKHPAPLNVPGPHAMTNDFHIMHYGKISPAYLSGKKPNYYAQVDAVSGKGTYEQRLAHHFEERRNETLVLKKCPSSWYWGKND